MWPLLRNVLVFTFIRIAYSIVQKEMMVHGYILKKKIWWSNAFWDSSQSFFNMFSSNPWHKLHSPGIFIVSFNQNLKYKPHKNSRFLFWFAQRDYEVISSHIQSLLWRKICFKLGVSLMNEWWTQPCEYSVNMQKSSQSEETGTWRIRVDPWIHCLWKCSCLSFPPS